MTHPIFFAMVALVLIGLGGYGLVAIPHLLRKTMALNIVSTGVFLVLVSLAARHPGAAPDPVPHAMVLTGIVVSVSATALLAALIRRYVTLTGRTSLPNRTDDDVEDRHDGA